MALPHPVRIAHAFGNTRGRLQRALEANVDMIEVDIWYRRGDVYAHHARRLNPLPILADKKSSAHEFPWYAFPIWPRYRAWAQVRPLRLGEILRTVAGKKHLLLDVKGRYKGNGSTDFAAAIARTIREHDAASWSVVCGQTYSIFDALPGLAADIEVRYSLEKPWQWEAFLAKLREDGRMRQVCISRHFLDEEKKRLLDENGVSRYVWTIDDTDTARRFVDDGAHGIISNDLALLAALPRVDGTGNNSEPRT